MFEELKYDKRGDSWELIVNDIVVYKGWTSVDWKTSPVYLGQYCSEKTGCVRVYSTVMTYKKHIAATGSNSYIRWEDNLELIINEATEEVTLPTAKQIALHKLKHPPMFPDDVNLLENIEIEVMEYLCNVLECSDNWHSLCDWEAYYKCSKT